MATAVSALVLALLLLLGAASAAVPDINAIYDALRKHGLPIGLVPQSIVDYHLSENGKFTLELADPCYAKFQEQVCCLFPCSYELISFCFEPIPFYSEGHTAACNFSL